MGRDSALDQTSPPIPTATHEIFGGGGLKLHAREQHRPAMRISISGWATTAEDIRHSADAIIAAAQRQAPGDR